MKFGTFRGNVNIFCTLKYEAMYSENKYQHFWSMCVFRIQKS